MVVVCGSRGRTDRYGENHAQCDDIQQIVSNSAFSFASSLVDFVAHDPAVVRADLLASVVNFNCRVMRRKAAHGSGG
jgi:hypothetical protein